MSVSTILVPENNFYFFATSKSISYFRNVPVPFFWNEMSPISTDVYFSGINDPEYIGSAMKWSITKCENREKFFLLSIILF